MPRYDTIGHGYAVTRREDPAIAAAIAAALGGARSVVNVGAGAGSYEPRDRQVIAIEPSAVMSAQRPPERVPAIRASARDLPLYDASIDAAMSVLSVHHWDDERERGVREMRRVARGPIIIVTYNTSVSGRMWLLADYLPESAALDRRTFPAIDRLRDWLGGTVTVTPIPISRETPDWHLGSFWAHPERVLDAGARNATSGFTRMDPEVIDRLVTTLRRDLESGAWDERYGHLRGLAEYDGGMRLVVAVP